MYIGICIGTCVSELDRNWKKWIGASLMKVNASTGHELHFNDLVISCTAVSAEFLLWD